MSRGARPASAQAARIASSAMSYSERPRDFPNAVCPMPTIAALLARHGGDTRRLARRRRLLGAPGTRPLGDAAVELGARREPAVERGERGVERPAEHAGEALPGVVAQHRDRHPAVLARARVDAVRAGVEDGVAALGGGAPGARPFQVDL